MRVLYNQARDRFVELYRRVRLGQNGLTSGGEALPTTINAEVPVSSRAALPLRIALDPPRRRAPRT